MQTRPQIPSIHHPNHTASPNSNDELYARSGRNWLTGSHLCVVHAASNATFYVSQQRGVSNWRRYPFLKSQQTWSLYKFKQGASHPKEYRQLFTQRISGSCHSKRIQPTETPTWPLSSLISELEKECCQTPEPVSLPLMCHSQPANPHQLAGQGMGMCAFRGFSSGRSANNTHWQSSARVHPAIPQATTPTTR